MKDTIFKSLIFIVSIIGIFLLYRISEKLESNRYQIIENNRIIDSKTGDIYFYSPSRGHYKYVNGDKIYLKSLPK